MRVLPFRNGFTRPILVGEDRASVFTCDDALRLPLDFDGDAGVGRHSKPLLTDILSL